MLNQIAIANESLGGGTIVVMAERDKEEMEADIAKMEFDLKGTAVICRSGSPLILADLKKVNTYILTYFFSVLNFDLLASLIVNVKLWSVDSDRMIVIYMLVSSWIPLHFFLYVLFFN